MTGHKEAPNGGKGRTAPRPVLLPIRALLWEGNGKQVWIELDEKNGEGVCRIETLHRGELVGVIAFPADALGGLRKLQRFFVQGWQANVISGDWPLTFFGALQRQ